MQRIPLLAGVASTDVVQASAERIGGTYFNPAVFGLTNTSTVVFVAEIETSSGIIEARVDLFQLTGPNAPQVLATLATTATVMDRQQDDVTAALGTLGNAQPAQLWARIYLASQPGGVMATCLGCWLEITP